MAAGGARGLAVYRFARELDWRVMSHHELSPGNQRHHAAALVTAFQELYGEQHAGEHARLVAITCNADSLGRDLGNGEHRGLEEPQ